jgi:hypothetical protein
LIINKRFFTIQVQDPNNFRIDNTYIDVDTTFYTADTDYLLAPQWLSPANLGVIRSDNNISIPLSVYDFNPFLGPTTYDWNTPTINQDGSPSVHPPNFNLDSNTGVLYATIPYQPAFNLNYNFTVRVIKTDTQTFNTTDNLKTFTLTIKGAVDNTINFISTLTLGTLHPGYISELKVEATYTSVNLPLLYTLVDGNLPPGLTLATDGAIQGRVDYDSITTFDHSINFTIDGGQTTFDKFYNFVIGAGDIYQAGVTTSTFRIAIEETTSTKFTQIYAQPFMPLSQRSNYIRFISDRYVFDPSIIYRPYDTNFGIQQKIKVYFEFGLEQINLDDFFTEALSQYFYRKQFKFGEVKFSKATDSNGKYIYDVVYVEIIDSITNFNNVVGPVISNRKSVYMNSVANMKNQLRSISINGSTIETDYQQLPRFMRTIQPNTNDQLGFVLVAPICYTLPGNGATVVEKIKIYGFDFKTIDFTIDRLILENNLTDQGAKYLIFPTKDSTGTNLGQSLSYITADSPGDALYTEDGYNLYLE